MAGKWLKCSFYASNEGLVASFEVVPFREREQGIRGESG